MLKKVEILDAKRYNKPINVKCIVSGKSISPYCIPKKIKISCKPGKGKEDNCKYCVLDKNKTISIDPVDENILKFIDTSSLRTKGIIKHICKISDSCKFHHEVTEMQNIERVFITPPADRNREKVQLSQISYYAGFGLDINTTYDMEGYTTIDPSNQTTTHVFTKAKKVQSDIESFKLTKSKYKELQKFAIKDPTVEKVYAHLEKVYNFYSHNITKIYNRFDLHLAVDLVFRSPLAFNFDNEMVHKGWVDAMIIGDTRCGKGYVVEKMVDYYGVGEVISAENCSFAGLVGGLQQINNHWVVTWGKIPLNDGGFVAIDEASELEHQDWTKLSRVRSEGIAEITKIHTQVTPARTRLLFLANPIKGTIANYSYGIQSLMDLVKAPEDVARFDYALVVAHNEVPIEDINSHKTEVKEMYDKKSEQDLILWTWSRKPEEIEFSKEAIDTTYKIAIKLAKMYSFDVPLIQGENVRHKLAKLAICFASRVFSNKKDGEILFVDKLHVECAYVFLHKIYKKEASGYFAMSKLQNKSKVSEDNIERIEKYFKTYTIEAQRKQLLLCLLSNNAIKPMDIAEHINVPKEIGIEIVSKLLENHCLVKKFQYYIKTSEFTNWLKIKILDK